MLRRELARRSWRREQFVVGTATDPYQPAEGRFRLTRGAIEALGEAATPFGLITRGPLIVRDVDVLSVRERAGEGRRDVLDPDPGSRDMAADRARHRAAATAPAGASRRSSTPDRRERRHGADPARALRRPREKMADVVRAARDAGATSIWTNVLYLRPGTREHFLENLARDWPELLPRYERLYAGRAYVAKDVARAGAPPGPRSGEGAPAWQTGARETAATVPARIWS